MAVNVLIYLPIRHRLLGISHHWLFIGVVWSRLYMAILKICVLFILLQSRL